MTLRDAAERLSSILYFHAITAEPSFFRDEQGVILRLWTALEPDPSDGVPLGRPLLSYSEPFAKWDSIGLTESAFIDGFGLLDELDLSEYMDDEGAVMWDRCIVETIREGR